MTTYILNKEEFMSMMDKSAKDGVILTNSMVGTLSINAPSPKKKYYSFGKFALSPESFDMLPELMDDYVPVLILLAKDKTKHDIKVDKITKIVEKQEAKKKKKTTKKKK